MLPFLLIPLTFLFVLLVVLIAKSPRTGAWLVAGLVFAAPVFLWMLMRAGMPARGVGVPLVLIPATFLFVLLIILLVKAPKAGAALVVALVVMGLLGLFFVTSHRRIESGSQATLSYRTRDLAARIVQQQTDHGAGSAAVHQEFERVFQDYVSLPAGGTHPSAPPSASAPIWSGAVEAQFDADIYPSQLAAVRALGLHMDRMIRDLVKDSNAPAQIVLFQESRDPGLLTGLKDAIQTVVSDLPCGIEAETRNIRPNEIGVELHFHDQDMQPAPWARSSETKAASGRIEVRAFTAAHGRARAEAGFVEKPWIEDFATFASNRPEQAFIVARSTGTCTSESEARQEALRDASQQAGHIVWNRRPPSRLPDRNAAWISPGDLERNGLVVDTFVQSFQGSVGKIWRQAVLLDVSAAKIAQLYRLKSGEVRHARESWARMGLSAVGVVVLIGVIYFFLNMATMGYYEWSLRIASVVLAVVGVLSILMVVK
jgi:hypothetical protein